MSAEELARALGLLLMAGIYTDPLQLEAAGSELVDRWRYLRGVS